MAAAAGPLRTALLCIDLQCDFMPGGPLGVHRGDEVIPIINKLRRICRDQLSLVAFTQDYHPEGHVSFEGTHVPPPPSPLQLPLPLQFQPPQTTTMTTTIAAPPMSYVSHPHQTFSTPPSPARRSIGSARLVFFSGGGGGVNANLTNSQQQQQGPQLQERQLWTAQPQPRQYVRLVYDKKTGVLKDCSRCGAPCAARGTTAAAAATVAAARIQTPPKERKVGKLGGSGGDATDAPSYAIDDQCTARGEAAVGQRRLGYGSINGGQSSRVLFTPRDLEGGTDGELTDALAVDARAAAENGTIRTAGPTATPTGTSPNDVAATRPEVPDGLDAAANGKDVEGCGTCYAEESLEHLLERRMAEAGWTSGTAAAAEAAAAARGVAEVASGGARTVPPERSGGRQAAAPAGPIEAVRSTAETLDVDVDVGRRSSVGRERTWAEVASLLPTVSPDPQRPTEDAAAGGALADAAAETHTAAFAASHVGVNRLSDAVDDEVTLDLGSGSLLRNVGVQVRIGASAAAGPTTDHPSGNMAEAQAPLLELPITSRRFAGALPPRQQHEPPPPPPPGSSSTLPPAVLTAVGKPLQPSQISEGLVLAEASSASRSRWEPWYGPLSVVAGGDASQPPASAAAGEGAEMQEAEVEAKAEVEAEAGGKQGGMETEREAQGASMTVAAAEEEVVVLQRLWPVHCVAGSSGADLVLELVTLPRDVIIRKGTRRDVDGYSAFFDNGRLHATGLHERLQAEGVSRLLVTGLATEYCVLWTVRDAVRLGYQVWVVADAIHGMAGPEEAAALAEMAALPGVLLLTSEQVISAAAAWPHVNMLALAADHEDVYRP